MVEGGGFEPPKVGDRQIYSLLPLATWLPLRKGLPFLFSCASPRLDFVAGGGWEVSYGALTAGFLHLEVLGPYTGND